MDHGRRKRDTGDEKSLSETHKSSLLEGFFIAFSGILQEQQCTFKHFSASSASALVRNHSLIANVAYLYHIAAVRGQDCQTYTVVAGDNCFAIGQMFGVDA